MQPTQNLDRDMSAEIFDAHLALIGINIQA